MGRRGRKKALAMGRERLKEKNKDKLKSLSEKKKKILTFGLWHRYHWIAQNLSILISPSTSIELNHITQNVTCSLDSVTIQLSRSLRNATQRNAAQRSASFCCAAVRIIALHIVKVNTPHTHTHTRTHYSTIHHLHSIAFPPKLSVLMLI